MTRADLIRSTALALAMHNIGAVYDPTNGMRVHYDAIKNTEDGHSSSAEIWFDHSGNGFDGELANTSWLEDALYLNGTNASVSAGMQTYPAVTIQVLVCFDSVIEHHWNCIANNFESGGYGLIIDGGNGHLAMVTSRYSDGYHLAYEPQLVETGRWYHLTGIASAGRTALYINGEKVAEIEESLGLRGSVRWFALGENPGGTSSGTPEHMQGKISVFRLYSRELSDAEIRHSSDYDRARYQLD